MAVQHFNQVELSRRWRLSPRTLERWRYRGTGPRYPQGWRPGRLPARRYRDARGRAAPRDRHDEGRHSGQAAATGASVSVATMARPRRIQPPRLTEIELLRLDRAGRARRRARIPPRLPRARPHRLRPFRRDAGPNGTSACSATAPTISPSAGSSTSSSSATGPRTTAISPSPDRAAKARSPTSQP